MNPEAQRIAIAEWRGWSDCRVEDAGMWGKCLTGIFGSKPYRQPPPDYLKNLNAMREVELALPEIQIEQYIRKLKYVCNPGCDLSNEHNQSWHVFATAAQRAEALLKTIGKWTEP